MKYTYLEVCAGCGGLSYGLEDVRLYELSLEPFHIRSQHPFSYFLDFFEKLISLTVLPLSPLELLSGLAYSASPFPTV